MGVLTTDIKFYKSTTVTDTTANGGAISGTEIDSNTPKNVFPDVTPAERIAGGSRPRKVFVKNTNSTSDTVSVYQFLALQEYGNDYLRIKAGTALDTWADASTYTEWAGMGVLNSSVNAGALSLTVDYDAADGVYDGSEIVIYDGVKTETVTVSGAPAWTGNQAVLTLAAGTAQAHTSGVAVSTRISLGDLAHGGSAGVWIKLIWVAGIAASATKNKWIVSFQTD